MCGIAGFSNFALDYTRDREGAERILEDMRRSLAHRGPDQQGAWLHRHVGLSHARLSIRDIQGGRQPMLAAARGADWAIVYNGEIYNTEELRRDLERRGYVFSTTSDTEVILCAYREHGPGCAALLNGIFAFAIWDGERQQLVLCRDRLGVKPLFYALRENSLVFASEIKGLFCHPAVEPEADLDSLRQIFALGPARIPGSGVFKGIQELLPGQSLIFSKAGLRRESYWALEARPHEDSYEATVEKVSWLIRDSVRRQMVSDVPVCSFLSGGLDSSIVTALAAGHMQAAGRELHTFSFDFTGNDRDFSANPFQPSRDRPYVDLLLPLLPVRHTYLECDQQTLAALLPQAVLAKDLPGMTDVDASLMYFCSQVAKQDKVALTGECADEIFGGYPWCYRRELMEGELFPWSRDMEARQCLLKDDLIDRLELRDYARDIYRQQVALCPRLPGEKGEALAERQIGHLNLRWFMQTLLDRMDRASMAVGLEARVPFADHRIVEYLYNVPWGMKYRPGLEKSLLRDACKGLLPDEVLYRKKSPYPKTYSPVYEALLAKELRQVLSDGKEPVCALLDKEKAERFLSSPKDYGRPWFGQLMAGPQLVAYLLQVNTWLKSYF